MRVSLAPGSGKRRTSVGRRLVHGLPGRRYRFSRSQSAGQAPGLRLGRANKEARRNPPAPLTAHRRSASTRRGDREGKAAHLAGGRIRPRARMSPRRADAERGVVGKRAYLNGDAQHRGGRPRVRLFPSVFANPGRVADTRSTYCILSAGTIRASASSSMRSAGERHMPAAAA